MTTDPTPPVEPVYPVRRRWPLTEPTPPDVAALLRRALDRAAQDAPSVARFGSSI